MMSIKVVTVLMLSLFLMSANCELEQMPECQPFGLRLNLGLKFYNQSSTQMLGVRFNTRAQCPKSYIIIQKTSSSVAKITCSNTIVELGNYVSYSHKCSVQNIDFGERFSYNAFGWSGNYGDMPLPFQSSFINTHLMNNNNQVRLVVLADWGYLRAKAGIYDPIDQAFKTMISMDEEIDGIYIGGDIAYDLDSYQGLYYEDFIKMLSQVASRWPLILNIGNHEHLTQQDQMISKASFQTYNTYENRVTVLNLPYVNLVMFDPYKIVFQNENPTELTQKLESTLKNLQQLSPEKPVITCSHYSYICNGNIPDCYDVRQLLMPLFAKMMQYNVALYLGAHHHSYQRAYPSFYNQTFVQKQSPYSWIQGGQQNFLDNSLITIVQGIAGNDRQIVEEYPPQESYIAAYMVNNTGFGIMTVNSNHLVYDHVNHNDPYASKDHWEIIFQRKAKNLQVHQSKNIRMIQQ